MNICIVTSKHVSYNPRVVKEADALSAAGHAVTVVTVCNHHEQARLDEGVMATRGWRLLTVNSRRQGVGERCRWLWMALRQRLFAKVLSRFTLRCGIAERAAGREFPELRRLAGTVAADLYIAHHAEALGAAWAAARRHGARFAFDAEDFHSGMFSPVPAPPAGAPLEESVRQLLAIAAGQPKGREQRCVEFLEQTYLPRCDYLTAASDGIGLAYALKYGLPRPTTILNVFPLGNTESDVTVARQPSPPFKLYWYSQVIGPGRGLETAVEALPLLAAPCELHLRGTAQPDYVAQLQERAAELEVAGRLFLHPPCPPDDLVREAARYDIGLALENAVELNRLICVTNKIFTYLNAGLAVVASDTPGQAGIMAQIPQAGAVCRMNDAQSLAAAVNGLVAAPGKLAEARRAARRAAEERFCWEREAEKLVE